MKAIEAAPNHWFIRRVRDAEGIRIRVKKVTGTKLRSQRRFASKVNMYYACRG